MNIEDMIPEDRKEYWVFVEGTEVRVIYFADDFVYGDHDGQYNFSPDEIELIAPYNPPQEVSQ